MDPAKRELAKSIRNSVKDTLADLTEQYFKTPLELVVEQGKACREPLRMLLNLVLEFDRRLLAAKQERHLIDFSDMDHHVRVVHLQYFEVILILFMGITYDQYLHISSVPLSSAPMPYLCD